MLEPIMAKAIAAEIGASPVQTLDSIKRLLESAAAPENVPVEDIYPRACAAALNGVADQLQELSTRLLEQAGLSQ